MAEAINAALRQAMERDGSVVVLGEDVGLAGGVFRITEGLLDEFGEERVIDTPLNESGIVGTAIGMAVAAARRSPRSSSTGSSTPPSTRSSATWAGPATGRGGTSGSRWWSASPTGPGSAPTSTTATAPRPTSSTPLAGGDLPLVARRRQGSARRRPRRRRPGDLPRAQGPLPGGPRDVPTEHTPLPIGRGRIRRTGDDVTLVTYGGMVPVSLQAAEVVAADGTSVEVIDLRTLFPWDSDTVLGSVERTGRVVVVQEPQRSAGVGAEVAATDRRTRRLRLGGTRGPGGRVRRPLAPVRHREDCPHRQHSGSRRSRQVMEA